MCIRLCCFKMFVLVVCIHIPVGCSCDVTDDDKDVTLHTDVVEMAGATILS